MGGLPSAEPGGGLAGGRGSQACASLTLSSPVSHLAVPVGGASQGLLVTTTEGSGRGLTRPCSQDGWARLASGPGKPSWAPVRPRCSTLSHPSIGLTRRAFSYLRSRRSEALRSRPAGSAPPASPLPAPPTPPVSDLTLPLALPVGRAPAPSGPTQDPNPARPRPSALPARPPGHAALRVRLCGARLAGSRAGTGSGAQHPRGTSARCLPGTLAPSTPPWQGLLVFRGLGPPTTQVN